MKKLSILLLIVMGNAYGNYGRVEKLPDLSHNMKIVMNERVGGAADERVVKRAQDNPDRHFAKDDFVIIQDDQGEYRHMKVVDADYLVVTDEKTTGIIKTSQIVGKTRPLFISQGQKVAISSKCEETIEILSHVSLTSHRKTFNHLQELLKSPWLTWKDLDEIVAELSEIKNHRAIQKRVHRTIAHGVDKKEASFKYWLETVVDPSIKYIAGVRDAMHA